MEKEKFEKRVYDFITKKDKQEGTINQMLQMDIVSIYYENKSIVLSFPVEKWALNTANNLHGGYYLFRIRCRNGVYKLCV